MNIKTVTIVGANGTMGTNVSAIFAAFGNAKVYVMSRDLEKSKIAVEKAVKSVRADSIKSQLYPVDYNSFEECIKESDLVFESVAESYDVKLEITKRIGKSLRTDAFVCTGTSGLSITRLAESLPEKSRDHYYGVHMFNPPYNMTLCELISTKYSNDETTCLLEEYLEKTLLRTVVRVKDAPAFLANRIGFYFINRALQYADIYKANGGIDYIDAILGPFTGRAMAPLVTADFVGLDIHKAIVDNVYQNTCDYENEAFALPKYVQTLITEGKLGRKVGSGLYKSEKSEDGTRKLFVYDIDINDFREVKKYNFSFASEMKESLRNGDYESALNVLINSETLEAKICLDFLLNYVVYALVATEEVGYDIHSADKVMATGFNWCPPLAMIDAFAKVTDFKTLVKERIDMEHFVNVDIDAVLSKVVGSRYDFRAYFKAK